MKFLKIKLKLNNKLKQIFNYPIKISLNYDVIKVLFILFQKRKILFIRNPKPIKKRKNEKKKKPVDTCVSANDVTQVTQPKFSDHQSVLYQHHIRPYVNKTNL